MIRICDGADDFSQDEHRMPCRCGRSYDDVDRSTIWPHNPVGPAPVIVRYGTPEADAVIRQTVTHLREGRRG